MPPGQTRPDAAPRHRGRDLAAMAVIVLGLALVLWGAFAAAAELGAAVLGVMFIGAGVVLGYESSGDRHTRPPAR